ncbi:transcriptional regulator GutM [Thermoanaerobacterium thermosaccharolyticum]|uniref:transcriptional regulator GutM n=1 Tax=Thermoanaerobacterium thermosaccharolyticum TaxID=1517 RepID=UPI003DA7B47C
MIKAVVFLFFLLFLQGCLSYLQAKNYINKLKELKKKGIVGVGVNKGKLSAGTIIMLVSDRNGTILDCEELHGVTVFSRFKKNNIYKGINIYNFDATKNRDSKRNNVLLKAIEEIKNQLTNFEK